MSDGEAQLTLIATMPNVGNGRLCRCFNYVEFPAKQPVSTGFGGE